MSKNQQRKLINCLIEEVQGKTPGTQERQSALTRVVDEILRSRPICRPLQGESLSGVCREIYQATRQRLYHLIDKDIDDYSPEKTPDTKWAKSRMNLAFTQILHNEKQLNRLAVEAQQHPQRSQQRQYLLTELVTIVQKYGKLIRPYQGSFSQEFYEVVYEDAINRTLLYVFQKIDLYDSQRGDFMNWVNFRLGKTFLELQVPNQIQSTTDDIEQLQHTESAPTVFEVITQCIEEDREGIFKKECLRNNQHVNFKTIFVAKRVDGKRWHDISEDLGIPVTTLSSFYWRCIQKFAPTIKQYVQEYA